MARKPKPKKDVEALTHREDSRRNIPTAELESVMADDDKSPVRVAFERRNRDLDPQLVWRGKDDQMDEDLVVQAPPLYIQEKVHPKALIDDLRRQTTERADEVAPELPDLFADFNGLPNLDASTKFYQHDQNWSNRMILGDSLQVMASLAEREGLRGKVQCIYIDPPYGIKFDSNFQWSTTDRDVTDGKVEHITREPEQVKAFRDTWRHGVHSYLSYLRDRVTVARELLADGGSIFVQIGDENVHLVRAVLDEIFGSGKFVAMVYFQTAANQNTGRIQRLYDCILWYKAGEQMKYRDLYRPRSQEEIDGVFTATDHLLGERFKPSQIKNASHRERAAKAGRVTSDGRYWMRKVTDNPYVRYDNVWKGTIESTFSKEKVYVVQTNRNVVQRCVLMTTDPGDLVLDPTCGSGTTAYVAEQWGRRWITIDTSRVALALARARLMGARYPYYLLADTPDGQVKEAEVLRRVPSSSRTYNDIRQGFVYRRVPHVTLTTIANNAEIDVIYEEMQPAVEKALAEINRALRGHDRPFRVAAGVRKGTSVRFGARSSRTVVLADGERYRWQGLLEWEVPREVPDDWPESVAGPLARFWEARTAKQREVDASIVAKADFEYLYDKPYEDKGKVRVAGPFTVESLTPHRVVEAERSDSCSPVPTNEVRDERQPYTAAESPPASVEDFAAVILEQLRTAGIQQVDKHGKIDFTALNGWPGPGFAAEGRYQEGDDERRAAVLIGSEHGTVGRSDLVAAAREAAEAQFDVLIACAFNYDAQTTELNQLGRLPILKARMNADLQMSTDLKKTKGGNLFVIFGEPDIDVLDAPDDQIQVQINGIDLFDPRTGNVRSSEPNDLACWFIDTDYDMASFFVRHAYFLGANDPYKALKTTLRAEIDPEAWDTLHSTTSRPFPKPASGRIAVKAINHLGDEVMKVIDVG